MTGIIIILVILVLLAIWVAEGQSFPLFVMYQFISVRFSRSVTSDSLQPHGLKHARPPCPSPTILYNSLNR